MHLYIAFKLINLYNYSCILIDGRIIMEQYDNYNKAYKEVDTILSYMPEENVNQIPLNMRNK